MRNPFIPLGTSVFDKEPEWARPTSVFAPGANDWQEVAKKKAFRAGIGDAGAALHAGFTSGTWGGISQGINDAIRAYGQTKDKRMLEEEELFRKRRADDTEHEYNTVRLAEAQRREQLQADAIADQEVRNKIWKDSIAVAIDEDAIPSVNTQVKNGTVSPEVGTRIIRELKTHQDAFNKTNSEDDLVALKAYISQLPEIVQDPDFAKRVTEKAVMQAAIANGYFMQDDKGNPIPEADIPLFLGDKNRQREFERIDQLAQERIRRKQLEKAELDLEKARKAAAGGGAKPPSASLLARKEKELLDAAASLTKTMDLKGGQYAPGTPEEIAAGVTLGLGPEAKQLSPAEVKHVMDVLSVPPYRQKIAFEEASRLTGAAQPAAGDTKAQLRALVDKLGKEAAIKKIRKTFGEEGVAEAMSLAPELFK